jgi:uncharacterized membrane protein YbaN (DUF454 family)
MRHMSLLHRIASSLIDMPADSTPPQRLRVVHSSRGRLRVHLPEWPGSEDVAILADVRRLPGVTHAEASAITGNLLIRFAPGQTNERVLLAALAELRVGLPPDAHTVQPADISTALPLEPTGYVTGARRILYQLLGWSSVGLAVIGAITPGIPTAPFVVLAGYFFIRSSPEAHQWLRQSRWFGPILRDWEEYRAIRPSVRNLAVGLIVFGMGFTALLGLPATLTATIITLQLLGLVIVMSLPLVKTTEVTVVPAEVQPG